MGKEKIKLICYRPLPNPIEKIKNRYRWRLIIKCIYDEEINTFLENVLEYINKDLKKDKFDTRVNIDINPRNML